MFSHFVFLIIGLTTKVFAADNNECILPPYPAHGSYNAADEPNLKPGQILDKVLLNVTCDPGYFVSGKNFVACSGGMWSIEMPECVQCGKTAPANQLQDGKQVLRGEAPWHVAVYTKLTAPYRQVCSGTLISTDTLISVAHCFWSENKKAVLPASNFAVAAGKVMKHWDAEVDRFYAQKSDVLAIKFTERFIGSLANFQDDIAIVKVAPFHFNDQVRPVCLDFDYNFDEKQLRDGNLGKVPAWELNSSDSQLQMLNVTAITIEKCIAETPAYFREFITSDKNCGLFDKDSVISPGNSGAGVVFPEMDGGSFRFYLRGVVSTSPRGQDGFSALVALTHILRHEHFIKNNLYI